jgi:hypothetical protein
MISIDGEVSSPALQKCNRYARNYTAAFDEAWSIEYRKSAGTLRWTGV